MSVGGTSRSSSGLSPYPFWLLPFLCSSILGPEAAISCVGSALVPRRRSLGSPALRRLLLCIVFASRINSRHVSSQFCNKSVKNPEKFGPFFLNAAAAWWVEPVQTTVTQKGFGQTASLNKHFQMIYVTIYYHGLSQNAFQLCSLSSLWNTVVVGGLLWVFSSDQMTSVCSYPTVTAHD